MIFLKTLLEFYSDKEKTHLVTYDFSPRRGKLLVINSKNATLYLFHEAFREVINYLETETFKNTSTFNVLTQIRNHIDSNTSWFKVSKMFIKLI